MQQCRPAAAGSAQRSAVAAATPAAAPLLLRRPLRCRASASSGAAPFPKGWGPRDIPSSDGGGGGGGLGGLLRRAKRAFLGDGLDRERLKALGMGAFASYGFVSNLNYGTALGISWLAFVKKYGVAPTAEGQWPVFLLFYSGMWAIQNFAR